VTDDVAEAREWFDVLPEAIGDEGLVVKGAGTRYAPGRRDWLKVNSVGFAVFGSLTRGRSGLVGRQLVVVCSWTTPVVHEERGVSIGLAVLGTELQRVSA
jgi:cephalosporin-C deacetylase-like acetyl esterase